ncbi:hypothetical protein ACQQ91_08475 [Selenomonas bovis]|uniref:hypothetical protein n=1 Tax=Selenomonas bovis TaxID=416586 RepID=UPI003D00B520
MEKQQKRHYYFGYYDGNGNFYIPVFEDEGFLSMAEAKGYPRCKVFDGKKKRWARLVPCSEAQARAFMHFVWNEQQAEMRRKRCMVRGKSGKLIRCPESEKCEHCPFFLDGKKEIYEPASVEYLVVNEATDAALLAASAEEQTVSRLLTDEIWAAVAELGDAYVAVLGLRAQGKKQSEIARELHIPPRTVSDMMMKMRTVVSEIL